MTNEEAAARVREVRRKAHAVGFIFGGGVVTLLYVAIKVFFGG